MAGLLLTCPRRGIASSRIPAHRNTLMSYESVREHLARCRRAAQQGGSDNTDLIQALEQLAAALEADLTQIKGALGHVAHLLERRQS